MKFIQNRTSQLLLLIFLLVTHETVNALGFVSRSCAAAGAQESITVDWGFEKYWLFTTSTHYRNGQFLHYLDSGGFENTWRSYAGHLATEFWYGEVFGDHWIREDGRERYLGSSYATDCNLGQWGTE